MGSKTAIYCEATKNSTVGKKPTVGKKRRLTVRTSIKWAFPNVGKSRRLTIKRASPHPLLMERRFFPTVALLPALPRRTNVERLHGLDRRTDTLKARRPNSERGRALQMRLAATTTLAGRHWAKMWQVDWHSVERGPSNEHGPRRLTADGAPDVLQRILRRRGRFIGSPSSQSAAHPAKPHGWPSRSTRSGTISRSPRWSGSAGKPCAVRGWQGRRAATARFVFVLTAVYRLNVLILPRFFSWVDPAQFRAMV
jgi:hypothetical protein